MVNFLLFPYFLFEIFTNFTVAKTKGGTVIPFDLNEETGWIQPGSFSS